MKEDVVVMEVVDISGVIPRFLLDRILSDVMMKN